MRLTNWTARRAGGRITIYGHSAADGNPAKIVGVDTITSRAGRVFAKDKEAEEHELVLA